MAALQTCCLARVKGKLNAGLPGCTMMACTHDEQWEWLGTSIRPPAVRPSMTGVWCMHLLRLVHGPLCTC